MDTQTKNEWETKLIGLIQEAMRAPIPLTSKRLAAILTANGVRHPQVVWKKETDTGPFLAISAEGYVLDEAEVEHKFLVWMNMEPLILKWVPVTEKLVE